MFSTTSATEKPRLQSHVPSYSSNEKLLNRIWKIINSTVGVATAGTAGGYCLGYVYGPAAISASVHFACDRLIRGMMGRLVATFAAPFFANHLANVVTPAAGVAGGIGTLGIYHSARWIYWCCYPDHEENNPDVLNSIKVIVKTIVLTSALDPKKADEFMNELYIQNPQLANIIMNFLSETISDIEEKKMMEDGFEMIGEQLEYSESLYVQAEGELSTDRLMSKPD